MLHIEQFYYLEVLPVPAGVSRRHAAALASVAVMAYAAGVVHRGALSPQEAHLECVPDAPSSRQLMR